MERLNCFMCKELINDGLNGLSNHFINVHGLTLNRGVGNVGFECGQERCRRRFKFFFSLRKHIKDSHLRNNVNEIFEPVQPFDIINMDFVGNDEIDNNAEININAVDDVVAEDTVDDNIELDLQTFIARMIGRLQSNGSMTGNMITSILDEFETLFLFMQNKLKKKVSNQLNNWELMNENRTKQLLDIFNIKNPFEGLRTLDQQIEVLKKQSGYISATEIPLGYRVDMSLNKTTCTYAPKMVMETFQYVSIIEVLKMVVLNDDVRTAILNEQTAPDGILSSFRDGDYFKVHPFFSRFPNALRIKLYYDEFEVVNPIGSKTGIHKLGVFYYKIQNIPPHMNSQLSDIHVLIVCTYIDIQKYGFERILEPFLHDLSKLESDEGVELLIGEEIFVLRTSIESFAGDGLGICEVYNLLGPSAIHFCHMCMYTRENLHAGSTVTAEERTEQLYNTHIAQLEAAYFSAETKKATGVKGPCCLNRSRYFHISRNKVSDLLHVYLLGLGPMFLKLTLRELILVRHKFTTVYFNGRISSFNYGYVENTNKPSANFTDAMLRSPGYHISQKGMQVWLLLRSFPFLVSKEIAEGDENVQLILDLLRVMEIVFAPKILRSLIPYLRNLIKDLMASFKKLFPDVNPINKLHEIDHHPECIEWMGPLWNYCCLREEAKHNEMKLRGKNVYNFKNPAKTLIRISQSVQCSKWGAGDVKTLRIHAVSGKVHEVGDTWSKNDLNNLGFVDDDEIFCCSSIRINGTEYREGLYVCLEVARNREDNLPLFGRILEIVVIEETNIFLQLSVCTTTYFDVYVNAYCIDSTDEESPRQFVNVFNLAHYKPFCCWKKADSDSLFISLRHILI